MVLFFCQCVKAILSVWIITFYSFSLTNDSLSIFYFSHGKKCIFNKYIYILFHSGFITESGNLLNLSIYFCPFIIYFPPLSATEFLLPLYFTSPHQPIFFFVFSYWLLTSPFSLVYPIFFHLYHIPKPFQSWFLYIIP